MEWYDFENNRIWPLSPISGDNSGLIRCKIANQWWWWWWRWPRQRRVQAEVGSPGPGGRPSHLVSDKTFSSFFLLSLFLPSCFLFSFFFPSHFFQFSSLFTFPLSPYFFCCKVFIWFLGTWSPNCNPRWQWWSYLNLLHERLQSSSQLLHTLQCCHFKEQVVFGFHDDSWTGVNTKPDLQLTYPLNGATRNLVLWCQPS